MTPTPLLTHPLFPLIAPWVRIEDYARDGGHKHPRHRLEMSPPTDRAFQRTVLAITCPCDVCGQMIHPIREARGRLYIATTCPLEVNIRCSRVRPTTAYDQIVNAVRALRTQNPRPRPDVLPW